jgi:Transposase and inactivated derivatives
VSFHMVKEEEKGMARKTIKHEVYTLEEKEEIIKEYLRGEIGRAAVVRKYDISSDSVLHRWLTMYREKGKITDERGLGSFPNKGKQKKIKPKEMSREELVRYVELNEDIKKSNVLLRKQKINIE